LGSRGAMSARCVRRSGGSWDHSPIRCERLTIRWVSKGGGRNPYCSTITAFTAYSADMNRAPAPVTSIDEMSLNRLWAAPKLPRLSFNHLAVSGRTVAVPPSDQLGLSAIRHPDVVEYLRQAGVVEVHRRVEHCGVPGLQMVCDDACLGVTDSRRHEQGLLTVDALDGVHHSSSSEHLPRWPSTALYVAMRLDGGHRHRAAGGSLSVSVT
jgi:hypothetical protein